ncbi:hypothetical protein BHYA_0148g00180 [Botrytis hyacinthi]|uniref:Uncharacterized protein n=1 Tax=Botrytis hyacinthi TaxID=278943 RepID=A0A4Z1GJY1_9HELO|nr:hypothetical protein BHYA_0148g00180 [Botrytis hyacinthi]
MRWKCQWLCRLLNQNRDISLFQLGDDAIAIRLLYASKIKPSLPTSKTDAHRAAEFILRLEHQVQRQSTRRSNLVNHHIIVMNVLGLQVTRHTTSSAVKHGTYLSESRINFLRTNTIKMQMMREERGQAFINGDERRYSKVLKRSREPRRPALAGLVAVHLRQQQQHACSSDFECGQLTFFMTAAAENCSRNCLSTVHKTLTPRSSPIVKYSKKRQKLVAEQSAVVKSIQLLCCGAVPAGTLRRPSDRINVGGSSGSVGPHQAILPGLHEPRRVDGFLRLAFHSFSIYKPQQEGKDLVSCISPKKMAGEEITAREITAEKDVNCETERRDESLRRTANTI